MHRLNLTIDEALYEQARLHSFVSKKSISQMVRESLRDYMETQMPTQKTTETLETALKALKKQGLTIEQVDASSDDYLQMASVKKQANRAHSIEEIERKLGL